MGTRWTAQVSENETALVTIYGQHDGYLEGAGGLIAGFLKGKEALNGYGIGQSLERFWNGPGCMAAALVAELKDGIGGIYIIPESEAGAQEYHYQLDYIGLELRVTVTADNLDWGAGTPSEFIDWITEHEG